MPLWDNINNALFFLPDYHYCETQFAAIIGSGSLQPLNFASNFVLLIYAIFCMMRDKHEGKIMGRWLAPAMLFVALGSFTWHGFNQPVFLLLDMLGVVALMLVLIWQFATRLSVNHLRAFSVMSVLAIIIFMFGRLVPLKMDAGGFLLMGFVFVLGGYMRSVNMAFDKMRRCFRQSGMLLIFAAFARALDLDICASISVLLGTHVLWHLAVFTVTILMVENMRNIPLKLPIAPPLSLPIKTQK
ncbi:MAG: hypothetical protein K0U45_02340 [Alphaproteobacteria bacterium]|nr:hypothetical protein [Alphaproteobacteria bacterium]